MILMTAMGSALGHGWSRGGQGHSLLGPLIAVFMGLRRGEIAQLRVQDFSIVNNIPIVAVAADAGIDRRSRKTANALRRLASGAGVSSALHP